jgi:hypothetical protein
MKEDVLMTIYRRPLATTYRVERLLIDPKTGGVLRMNKLGDAYDTLEQARKAARDYGALWLITEERIVAVSPEAEALIQKEAA